MLHLRPLPLGRFHAKPQVVVIIHLWGREEVAGGHFAQFDGALTQKIIAVLLGYLIHDRGIAWFKQELKTHYSPHPIKGLRLEPTTKLEDYLGWHRQSRGLWFVGLPVLCGRLSGEFKSGLRRLVDTYKLEVRLTPNQDLLLCNIGTAQRSSVREALAALGITAPEAPPLLARHAIACPALPLCGLAVTEAERILPDVLERLDDQLRRLEIE